MSGAYGYFEILSIIKVKECLDSNDFMNGFLINCKTDNLDKFFLEIEVEYDNGEAFKRLF